MKPEELMIGDWVEVPFFEGKPKIIKVEEILSDEINPEWDGMENYGGIKIKYVKPILLTPEILEKNGFEYNDGNAKYYPNCWEKNGILLRKRTLNGFFYLVTSDYDDQDTNSTSIIITYVHELQHLLKLCGIEKTIEL